MVWAIVKVVISAILISFVSWLSSKKVGVAGFLTALPLTTLIALAFGQIEWEDSAQSVAYAKQIFIAVPLSLLFFVPFLFSQKLQLSFWTCYILGLACLGLGYIIYINLGKLF